MTRMHLYDTCTPHVLAGEKLEFSVMQTLSRMTLAADKSMLDLEGADQVVHVKVQGPRCVLGADDVAGAYPAPASADSPADFLPHVALRRRTLPWERRGPTMSTTERMPWLALLLVKESEFASPRQSTPATATPEQITVGQLKNPANPNDPLNMAYAELKAGTSPSAPFADSDRISVAYVRRDVLARILPTQRELGLLCHMKRTVETVTPQRRNPADAQPPPYDITTDTAIVLCNRLPTVSPVAKPEVHTALLVSLERRSLLYAPHMQGPQGADRALPVALVVLHHWSFTPTGGGDFEQVMKEIRYRPNGGVLRFGNLPATAAPGEVAALGGGFEALLDAHGYPATPLVHAEAGAVAYAGPLRPSPVPRRNEGFAIRAAPQELASGDGEHDYSHAAAFELGRLLALHDAGILDDLRRARTPATAVLDPPAFQVDIPDILVSDEWVKAEGWRNQPWNAGKKQLVKTGSELQAMAGAADQVTGPAIDKLGEIALDKLGAMSPPVIEPATQFDVLSILPGELTQTFSGLPAAVVGTTTL